jgi:hypothetical protein
MGSSGDIFYLLQFCHHCENTDKNVFLQFLQTSGLQQVWLLQAKLRQKYKRFTLTLYPTSEIEYVIMAVK